MLSAVVFFTGGRRKSWSVFFMTARSARRRHRGSRRRRPPPVQCCHAAAPSRAVRFRRVSLCKPFVKVLKKSKKVLDFIPSCTIFLHRDRLWRVSPRVGCARQAAGLFLFQRPFGIAVIVSGVVPADQLQFLPRHISSHKIQGGTVARTSPARAGKNIAR